MVSSKNIFKLLFIALIIFSVSCSKEKIISADKIEKRNGIVYEVNSESPFSGKVIKKYGNGHNKKVTNYKNGIKNGLETIWYKNGQIKEETKYKESKKNGLSIKWYENGQRMEEINYANGDKDSVSTFWDKDGNVIGLYMYYKDNLVHVTLNGKTIYYFIESSFDTTSSAKSVLIKYDKKVYKVLDDNSMQLKNAMKLLAIKKDKILNELIAAKNSLKDFTVQNDNIKLSDQSLSLIQIAAHFEAERNKVHIEMEMNKENIKQLKNLLKRNHDLKKIGQELFHFSLRYEALKEHYNQLVGVVSAYVGKFDKLTTKEKRLVNLELKKQSLEKLYIEVEKKYLRIINKQTTS